MNDNEGKIKFMTVTYLQSSFMVILCL